MSTATKSAKTNGKSNPAILVGSATSTKAPERKRGGKRKGGKQATDGPSEVPTALALASRTLPQTAETVVVAKCYASQAELDAICARVLAEGFPPRALNLLRILAREAKKEGQYVARATYLPAAIAEEEPFRLPDEAAVDKAIKQLGSWYGLLGGDGKNPPAIRLIEPALYFLRKAEEHVAAKKAAAEAERKAKEAASATPPAPPADKGKAKGGKGKPPAETPPTPLIARKRAEKDKAKQPAGK